MRAIYRKQKNRASLVDDILTTWKKERTEHKPCLDEFQKAIDFRNWLAHGRYWTPKKIPQKYDFLNLYSLADGILQNIELVES